MYAFNALEQRKALVEWIRDWFEANGKGCNAVLGISGGKDSTVAAALCAEALGKDHVIGIMLPDGEQKDIKDSRDVIKALGIRGYEVNIGHATYDILAGLNWAVQRSDKNFEITKQTMENLPPRIRMATIYALSQSMNGRVINTCNLSENVCGYSTLYGDHAGDFSLFDQLTASEVVEIGLTYSELPAGLVKKAPADGLCGKTDEDNLGFAYAVLDKFIRTGVCEDEETKKKILKRYKGGLFKTRLIHFPHYEPGLDNHIEQYQ